MSTEDFFIGLFCRVDELVGAIPKHFQATLYPSEVVTLALLSTLKGVGPRAYYHWLKDNWTDHFPISPECTRSFRLFATHCS